MEVQMRWVPSYSSRPSTYYFTDRGRGVNVEDDRRSQRSPDEQQREPTQIYCRVRKGKEPVQPHGYPTDACMNTQVSKKCHQILQGRACLLL